MRPTTIASGLVLAVTSASAQDPPAKPWCMSKTQTECYYDVNRDAREAMIDKSYACDWSKEDKQRFERDLGLFAELIEKQNKCLTAFGMDFKIGIIHDPRWEPRIKWRAKPTKE